MRSHLKVKLAPEHLCILEFSLFGQVGPVQAVEHDPERAPYMHGLGIHRQRLQVAAGSLVEQLLVAVADAKVGEGANVVWLDLEGFDVGVDCLVRPDSKVLEGFSTPKVFWFVVGSYASSSGFWVFLLFFIGIYRRDLGRMGYAN